MVEDWVNSNHLTLNSCKCKYMDISWKRCPSAPTNSKLASKEMEKVECFKYLGNFIGNYMSLANHIDMICSKVRKLIGLLYRRFNGANSVTLLQLYLTMIRPHLEYASPVWSPFIHKEVRMIEDVEKFTMTVITRSGTWGTRICWVQSTFPPLNPGDCMPPCAQCTNSAWPMLFPSRCYPCSRGPNIASRQTDNFSISFLLALMPHATHIWNCLPEQFVMSSFSTFKDEEH